jgi:hypothetical protein
MGVLHLGERPNIYIQLFANDIAVVINRRVLITSFNECRIPKDRIFRTSRMLSYRNPRSIMASFTEIVFAHNAFAFQTVINRTDISDGRLMNC